jgi:PmbA protein
VAVEGSGACSDAANGRSARSCYDSDFCLWPPSPCPVPTTAAAQRIALQPPFRNSAATGARRSCCMPKSSGASACEVDVSDGFGQSVTVRCGEVETIEYNRDKGISVDRLPWSAKRAREHLRFFCQALRETVEAALNIARFTAADPCAGLPDARTAGHRASRFCPISISIIPGCSRSKRCVDLARRCEQAAFAVSPQISNSEGATVSIQEGQFVSANSLGFMGGYPTSRHYLSCSVIAGKNETCSATTGIRDRRAMRLAIGSPESIGELCRATRPGATGRAQGQDLQGAGPVRGAAGFLADRQLCACCRAAAACTAKRPSWSIALASASFRRRCRSASDRIWPGGLASSRFDSDGVVTQAIVRSWSTAVLAGLFPECLLSARKLGMQSHGECRRLSQPNRPAREAMTLRGLLKKDGPRPSGDGIARPGRELRDRGLFARGGRLLDRRTARSPASGRRKSRLPAICATCSGTSRRSVTMCWCVARSRSVRCSSSR